MGVWSPGSANVTGVGEPEQVKMIAVTDGVLEALNVTPAVGRWLSHEDQVPNGPERVMLNYGYWQRKFGGDRTVVGRNILVDSRPKEIVGVMPRGFRIVDKDFDVLAPLSFDRGKAILAGFGYQGIARLKPGVTIAQADADMTRMLPIWMDTFTNGPGSNPHIYESWKITPQLRPLKDEVIGNVSDTLWVVMGTIALVMLIACANVTNLFLVRGESRQQEMAVRAALGASAVRIVRALLVESVMLGLMGGVGGHGDCVLGCEIFDGDRSGEFAAAGRDCGGLADAGVWAGAVGGCGAVVWIDSGAEVRTFARGGVVSRGGGKDDEREPRAASRAKYSGGWASGDGAGAAGVRRADDSDV